MISSTLQNRILSAQRNEITEHFTYLSLAKKTKDSHNREILEKIAADEKKHYEFLKTLSKQDLAPNRLKILLFSLLGQTFGLSFALKLMENGEDLSIKVYSELAHDLLPQAAKIVADEQKHESSLLELLSEERIEYAGSIVLGLNDALVELTGSLCGLTLALQNPKIIALSGLVIGIAASMSMAASEYLSSREEKNETKKPFKSAVYTGIAYILTVLLLVLPYFVFSNVFVSLAAMLVLSILIIFSYTFYITTVKSQPFWRRFLEMAGVSITVAILSFAAGLILKTALGVDA